MRNSGFKNEKRLIKSLNNKYFSGLNPNLQRLISQSFQKYEDFKPAKLAEKILLVVKNFKFYKKRAIEYSYLYSFEKCGQQYLTVFQKYLLNTSKKNFQRA